MARKSRVRKLKLNVVVSQLNTGVTFAREFRACVRTIPIGKGKIGGPEHLRSRHTPTCALAPSPRRAVAKALESLASSIKGRKGHKRYGHK